MLRGVTVGAAVTLALLATACGKNEVSVAYRAQYKVGFDNYDDRAAKAQLNDCLQLPGAASGGQNDSMPPQPLVLFTGSDDNRRDLEACLRRLPNATFTSRAITTPPSGS